MRMFQDHYCCFIAHVAKRVLPALNIKYRTIHLKQRVPSDETSVMCTENIHYRIWSNLSIIWTSNKFKFKKTGEDS